MSRSVIVPSKAFLIGFPESDFSLSSQNDNSYDRYFERLIKYTPPEVIAFYFTCRTFLITPQTNKCLLWAAVIVGVIGTPLYLYKAIKTRNICQLLLCTLSFLLWAASFGSPFDEIPWYSSQLVALSTTAFVFLAPLISSSKEIHFARQK